MVIRVQNNLWTGQLATCNWHRVTGLVLWRFVFSYLR